MKVAIIHYWFITRRGGEKVVETILKLYPNADIYTLFYNEKEYGDYLKNNTVYTSILNTSFLKKHYQKIFPLYPIGIKSLKLQQEYDLIISSESGPAKAIQIDTNTPHICYIHSPMRYCWSHQDVYLKSVNYFLRPFMSFFLKRLKEWDKKSINNVDLYISNSNNVASRVKKFYNKESLVIHPPIEESLFENSLNIEQKEYYLSFGAITPYKKIDLLVDTFNKNGKKLIIIGNGSEKKELIKRANKNIEFKNYPNWKDVEKTIYKAKALLFPGEEDFGMIPLEVMSYGIPVLAYGKGGALETVVEDREKISKSTGLFFHRQKIKDLNETIIYFETIENKFDPYFIREHSKKFIEGTFLEKLENTINFFLQNKLNK